jgi:hypothetical protein
VEEKGTPSGRGGLSNIEVMAATSPSTQMIDKCELWEGRRVPPLQEMGCLLKDAPHLQEGRTSLLSTCSK